MILKFDKDKLDSIEPKKLLRNIILVVVGGGVVGYLVRQFLRNIPNLMAGNGFRFEPFLLIKPGTWLMGWLLLLVFWLALWVFKLCPSFIIELIIWIFAAVLAVDILASYMLVTGRKGRFDKLERANNAIANATAKLGKWIALHVEKRITKAYPQMEKSAGAEKEAGFAKGCSFYKIILLFFIGAFLGDVTETIFCRLTAGVWMSRSSVVWGPFSIVWGFAIAAVTLLLYKYKDRSDSFLFGTGTLLGGAYEYLCSVFTEIVFGKIFWDYSGMPFNLGGRINLLYCFFWGIAAVVWFKKLYPKISGLIEKIPHLAGKIITWTLIIFMCCNIVVSCMALIRYDERGNDVKADRAWKTYMDEHYGDEKMQLIYPNAKMTD